MSFLKTLVITFSMYSAIPMPILDWDQRSMERVFCCFPMVGCLIGAVLMLWIKLCGLLQLSVLFTAAGAALIPVLLTGGIHLDGLCDVSDALGSHQSRERMLEIMKDPHIGAFGVLGCVIYLILLVVFWNEMLTARAAPWLCLLIPVCSRSWVGVAAVFRNNARGSGLLATFTTGRNLVQNRVITVLWLVLSLAILVFCGVSGIGMAAASVLFSLYYYGMTKRTFGGITGDLAGWYLQMLELVMLLGGIVAERMVFLCA